MTTGERPLNGPENGPPVPDDEPDIAEEHDSLTVDPDDPLDEPAESDAR